MSLRTAFSIEIPGWMLRLLRGTLYLWTHPKVFPETPDKLGLKPEIPVCYVLQYRHLSNLLVLDQECRNLSLPRALRPIHTGQVHSRQSVFYLSSETSDAGIDENTPPTTAPSLLVQLVREALRDPEFDVQLVPATILWGRAPDKQDSIIKALFAEAWQSVGVLSQFVATIVNGRDTVVRFSEPISLREILRNEDREERAAHKLARVLRVHFRRQREIAIGPNLSHRQTQMHILLSKPEIRSAIAADAIKRSVPFAEAERAAQRYALEIASDYSYSVIQALVMLLDWVWTRIYDGLAVHHFDRVTEIARTHSVVYIPCHRSHIDYLLISFLLYVRGVSIPHIAAGSNLNVPVLGPILRRAGAFFLRRKIKDNALYAIIFNEYLSLMISQGFPIEYFIEGGRSRSGRMLRPKAGMLAMTIQSFVKHRSRPLAFIPIYIGYEKLMEGSTYIAELGGKPKKGESLIGLLGSLRELKKYFGKVHINFGTPLLLSNFLDVQQPDWATLPAEPKTPWMRDAVNATATELARRINAAAVVNPINLIALSLLSTPKHTADLRQLKTQIGHIQFLLETVPYGDSVVTGNDTACDAIDHAIRLELVRRQPHPLGDMIIASAEQSSLLAYFRNNVLHLLALPALLACLVSHNRLLSRDRAKEAIVGIYSLLRAELFLTWEIDQLDVLLEQIETAFVNRGLITVDNELGILRSPLPSNEANAELRQIGEIIRPTLERQFLTLALLQNHGSGKMTREMLEQSGHLLAQRLSLLYEFNSPEFSERALFANVILNLIEAELLRLDEDGHLHFDQRITAPAAQTELLLSPAVRHSIERLASHDPAPEATAMPAIEPVIAPVMAVPSAADEETTTSTGGAPPLSLLNITGNTDSSADDNSDATIDESNDTKADSLPAHEAKNS
jgi:glycerol-3-phosphate O-acyltransferase